ncbi:MAG: hypothetical protein IIC49_04120, partial [Planctomycetes bacterium]|nr:hypothetical protein [Planctomycetota bacterium]
MDGHRFLNNVFLDGATAIWADAMPEFVVSANDFFGVTDILHYDGRGYGPMAEFTDLAV